MNECIICGREFEPPKGYEIKKTCSRECLSIHLSNLTSVNFRETSYKKGHTAFNKGVPQKEWLSPDKIEKCRKHQIQYQSCKSPLSIEENRYLPHNTKIKGTITKRYHTFTKGKNKGKTDYEYYINIDWHGNRKPNNLYKRYIWEVYNQQDVPDGYVVYCKDGNKDNLEVSNLILITRKELLIKNRQNYLERKKHE